MRWDTFVTTIGMLFFSCLISSLVMADWNIETVDSAGDVGQYASLALDNSNNPAISYRDRTNKSLKFARKGINWVITTVDDPGKKNVGLYTSLAFHPISHNPAISYLNLTHGILKYAYDANGDGDFADAGEKKKVDGKKGAGPEVGLYTSLAFDALGRAGISYYDWSNASLKYAYSDDGVTWSRKTVDSEGEVGDHTSLAFDASGKPAIAYHKGWPDDDLMLARSNDADGTSWTIITVDSTGLVGMYTSLAFDASGKPAISYYDFTNGNLKFAYDRNGDGDFADAGEIITVDDTGDVGLYTSLAFKPNPSGYPGISYYDATNGDLKFVRDLNNDGDFNDANERYTVDTAEDVGLYSSLAFHPVSGNPLIAYYDNTDGDLRYAEFAQ